MAGKRKPGPVCKTKGHPSIDKGTLCRQQSAAPGPAGKESTGSGGWMGGVLEWAEEQADWASEKAKGFGSTASGQGKAALITILDLIPFKPDSPHSTAFLEHYVKASGEKYEMKEIPKDWQDWIVKTTKGKPGRYRELDPYDSGIFDLRNSLGHFDVTVTHDKKTGTKTYRIEDIYQFGHKKNDRQQRGRHGFPCGDLDDTQIRVIRALLPSGEYQNPGGFKERWEIRKVGKETILFIPQQFLAENGKPFKVEGTFAR